MYTCFATDDAQYLYELNRHRTKQAANCTAPLHFFFQALPDAEEWLRHNMITAVGSMLIKAPGKVFKGTVNTAHSIATKSIRGVGGLVNHTGVRGRGKERKKERRGRD